SSKTFACETINVDYYIELLRYNPSIAKRYTAVKALAYFPNETVDQLLSERVKDSDEHIYVRLEASAYLARRNNPLGFEFIQECLRSITDENRLEATLILGEIDQPRSKELLIETLLNRNQLAPVRAAAAWCLGEVKEPQSLNALVSSFLETDDEI